MTGDARTAALALLAERRPDQTICPSEVARALAPKNWRAAMPTVHASVDALLSEGVITLRWKGRPLPARVGPYRIGRGPVYQIAAPPSILAPASLRSE